MLASYLPDLLHLPTSTRNLALATTSRRVRPSEPPPSFFESVERKVKPDDPESRIKFLQQKRTAEWFLATTGCTKLDLGFLAVGHGTEGCEDDSPPPSRLQKLHLGFPCRWTRHRMFSSRCLFDWRWAAETHGRVTLKLWLFFCSSRHTSSRTSQISQRVHLVTRCFEHRHEANCCA